MRRATKFLAIGCLMLLLISVGSATTLMGDKSRIPERGSSFGPSESVSMMVVLENVSGSERIGLSTSFEEPQWDIRYEIGYGKGNGGNLSSKNSSISLPKLPYRNITVNLNARAPAMDRDGRLVLIGIKDEETDAMILRECVDVYGKFTLLQRIEDGKGDINNLESGIISYENEGIDVSGAKNAINNASVLIKTAERDFRIDGDYGGAVSNLKDAEGQIQVAKSTLEMKKTELSSKIERERTIRNTIYLVIAIAIVLGVVIILMRRGGREEEYTRPKL